MLIKRSEVERLRSDRVKLQAGLRELLAAVDALHKEEQNPVPCYVMKKITREHLFKMAREMRESPLVY